jgi:hypothetical protein
VDGLFNHDWWRRYEQLAKVIRTRLPEEGGGRFDRLPLVLAVVTTGDANAASARSADRRDVLPVLTS